jgi:hypothetical protein
VREATLPPVTKPSRKVQAWTRSKLYRRRESARLEAKLADRASRRKAKSASWKDQKREAAFEGCDPARTLALVGEDA